MWVQYTWKDIVTPRQPATDSAIGVFDSGLGGLTVVRELRRLLPAENIIYLGDTARVPYGTRTASTVRRYAAGCAELLRKRNIKSLVVACNTVSAVAMAPLEQQLQIPVIGVVKPGAKAAIAVARQQQLEGLTTPKIGILGTPGTIRSSAYAKAIVEQLPEVEVLEQAAPLLVPLVEEGWLSGEVPTLAVERYVQPMIDQRVTVLVLGCTHYPLLVPVFREVSGRISPRKLQLVDGARACAQAVVEQMTQAHLITEQLSPGKLTLLATDLPDNFLASAQRFLGKTVTNVHQVDIVPSSAASEELLPEQ